MRFVSDWCLEGRVCCWQCGTGHPPDEHINEIMDRLKKEGVTQLYIIGGDGRSLPRSVCLFQPLCAVPSLFWRLPTEYM